MDIEYQHETRQPACWVDLLIIQALLILQEDRIECYDLITSPYEFFHGPLSLEVGAGVNLGRPLPSWCHAMITLFGEISPSVPIGSHTVQVSNLMPMAIYRTTPSNYHHTLFECNFEGCALCFISPDSPTFQLEPDGHWNRHLSKTHLGHCLWALRHEYSTSIIAALLADRVRKKHMECGYAVKFGRSAHFARPPLSHT